MVETGNKFHDNVGKRVAWAHWFTFFNIVALSLISLRYIVYSGLANTIPGIAYQFISLIGHFSFLSAVVFILVIFPLAFLIRNNLLYRIFSIFLATIAITFLIVDTQIFRLYDFHLNPLIWQFLQKPEQVEAIYSINLHYISIPITFCLQMFFSYILWRKVRNLQAKHIGKPIAIVLFLCFISSHLIFVWADATQYRDITNQKSIYPLSYPMTARTFLKRQGWLTEDSLQKATFGAVSENNKELNYPLAPLTYAPATADQNKNILIINVEALRADMLNTDNMPYLQSLSAEGLNFKNHFSGANNSRQGVFSLFYGLPNSYWGIITDNHISPVLMDKIAENHAIGLFSSIGMIHPEFLQSSFSQLKNIDNVYYAKSQNNSQVLQQWSQWLSSSKAPEPWFSYVYLEQRNALLFSQNNQASIPQQAEYLTLYQNQVREIDQQIEKLVNTLKQQKEYQDTIIVITGTHGQSFKGQSTNNHLISEANVPLIIIWPGKAPKEIFRMTSHLDFTATLMEEVFGVENPSNQYSSGQSLFNDTEREYVLSGDLDNYVIYENRKITQFSGNGNIDSIDWQGNHIEQDPHNDKFNITLFIDVLSKLRRFN
ncbi:DUF3413 domain-containing protein [Psychromonas aquatilis]|uniref:DUF3413 domain-containing protein n=1 Tax=Psychromonas aquatilis TaxID=2005072 RepID=A0ABU9GQ43_9GAMM